MFTPAAKPGASYDLTEALERNRQTTKPRTRAWYLWPCVFFITTTASGSKTYGIECRPLMKFAIGLSFFWKNGRKS